MASEAALSTDVSTDVDNASPYVDDFGDGIVPQADIDAIDAADAGESSAEGVTAEGGPGSETAETAAQLGTPGTGKGEETSGFSSLFDDEIQRLEGPAEPETQNQELELPEGVEADSKAANRWQQLANTNREVSGQMQQVTAHNQALQQHSEQTRQWAQGVAQQSQQQVAQLTQQLQHMQMQFQQMQQQPQGPARDPNDPLNQLQDQWMSAAAEQRRAEQEPLMQRIHQLEQMHVAGRQQAQKAQADARHRTNSAQSRGEAVAAARNVALAGFPEDTVNELQDVIAAQVLTHALYHRTSIPEAAKMVRLTHLKFGRAVTRSNSETVRAGLNKSAAAATVPRGQSGANGKGVAVPSTQELARQGYTGVTALLDWSMKNGVALPDL